MLRINGKEVLSGITMHGVWTAIGTVTLPAVTLGGIITGGSQVINSLGHIGIGAASRTDTGIFYAETYTDLTESKIGVYSQLLAKFTANNDKSLYGNSFLVEIVDGNAVAAYTGTIYGVNSPIEFDAQTQAQTFTNVRHLDTFFSIGTNVTLTNRYGMYIRDATGAGVLTNQYGIYIEAMAKGGTLNWGVYSLAPTYLGNYLSTISYHEFTEMAAPGAGGANTARVYAVVGGDTLTDLAAVFQDGTVAIFAQEATEPDSPIFQFPDNTELKTIMRKPDRKTIQFVAQFPDGREFVMSEIQYPMERW